jgi:hypothetical protein
MKRIVIVSALFFGGVLGAHAEHLANSLGLGPKIANVVTGDTDGGRRNL